MKVVGSVDDAIAHINTHGSHHSDAIVTSNEDTARRFWRGWIPRRFFTTRPRGFTMAGSWGWGPKWGFPLKNCTPGEAWDCGNSPPPNIWSAGSDNSRSKIPRACRPPLYGFFGGSFDPIQKGHIALAQAALRERKLARVYLVPAARSPLKHKGPRASSTDRAALIRAAIRGRPGLALGPWEMDRPGPSYLSDIASTPPDRPPSPLGTDFRRRRMAEFSTLAALAGNRRAGSVDRGKKNRFFWPSRSRGRVFLKTRIPAVSSTEIRTAFANGRSVRRWLAAPVARLIKNRGLYSMRSNNSSILRKSSARSRPVARVIPSGGSLGQRIGPASWGRPGWRNGLDCFTIWPRNGPPLGWSGMCAVTKSRCRGLPPSCGPSSGGPPARIRFRSSGKTQGVCPGSSHPPGHGSAYAGPSADGPFG
jgi:nicotinic acid mononucleotide adenylyltransferase